MRALKATTLPALQKALPALEAGLQPGSSAQRDFYQFAFRFCLTVRVGSCAHTRCV